MLFRFIFMATIVASTAWTAGCNRITTKKMEVLEPTILPVKVAKITRRKQFSFPLNFYGRIDVARESALSFELDGRVATILVDAGDEIREGQTLATLHTDSLVAERELLIAKKSVEEAVLKRVRTGERPEVIAAAQAAVERLQVEVKRASINEQREKKLLQTKSISESRYDQLKYDYEALRLSLREKEARLAELKAGAREEDIVAQTMRVAMQDAELALLDTQIRKSKLDSPFAGHVIQRILDDGTVVKSGQPVLIISELTNREARFALPIMYLPQVAKIQSVSVGNRQVPVKDARVISKVDRSTRTMEIVFVLDPSVELISGQTCGVTLTKTIEQECVELPVDSLVPSIRGLWSCYRIEPLPDGAGFEVVKEEVTIEHTQGDRVFATTTLSDGDQVIVDGVQKLVPGMRVRPVSEIP